MISIKTKQPTLLSKLVAMILFPFSTNCLLNVPTIPTFNLFFADILSIEKSFTVRILLVVIFLFEFKKTRYLSTTSLTLISPMGTIVAVSLKMLVTKNPTSSYELKGTKLFYHYQID